MTPKALKDKEKPCIESTEAIDLVGMTEGLIKSMTDQSKRLKDRGYDTTNINRRIKDAKARLRATKRRLKG